MRSDFGQVRMSFCPVCGRQRNGGSRFCSGCGHEFREPAAQEAAPPTAGPPGESTRLDPPLDATRWDAPVDATRLEPRAEPDPFAAWFAPEAPAPGPGGPGGPGGPSAGPPPPPGHQPDGWQTADTVYSTPAPAPGYRPPAPPGPGWPQPQGPGYDQRSPRSSRGARAALIIVVVLLVLAAGGGAYAYISRSKTPSAASPPSTATATPSATASTGPSTASSPSPSTSASPSPSASASPSLVGVASGVGSNPATPRVETVLTHFFQGINTHNYTEYASALDPQEQAQQTQATFNQGYATSSDSDITLTSLTSDGSGGQAATVTFTSHQAASSSVDKHSTCNHWTLTFYLVPSGTGYLDGPAPSGYRAKYSDC